MEMFLCACRWVVPSNLSHSTIRNGKFAVDYLENSNYHAKGNMWAIFSSSPVLEEWVMLGSVKEKSMMIHSNESPLGMPAHNAGWAAWRLVFRSCLALSVTDLWDLPGLLTILGPNLRPCALVCIIKGSVGAQQGAGLCISPPKANAWL